MTTIAAQPHVLDPAVDRVDDTLLDRRTLIVPMGGTGWGWRLFSRWAIIWSLHEVLGIVPGRVGVVVLPPHIVGGQTFQKVSSTVSAVRRRGWV
jgi:hypothetical protein